MPHDSSLIPQSEVPVIDGPSSDRLVDAYKYAFDKRERHTVTFTDDEGQEYTVKVTGLFHEDGSGQSHMFTAMLVGFKMRNPQGQLFEARIDRPHVRGYWYGGTGRHGDLSLSVQFQPLTF